MTTTARPDNFEQPRGITTRESLLTSQMLAGFEARARRYDEQNAFFSEDFEELREAGYLRLADPDGARRRRADARRGRRAKQRRLGYHAAPTALAINMHLYWTGVAADLWRAGDTSLRGCSRRRPRGQVFAAGHAESGNDIPVLLSTTKAERVDGGYRFTGRKSFGSLIAGLDVSRHPRHGHRAIRRSPKIVHAFMPRDTEGYRIEETWDVLGMRATRSDDTILDGVVRARPLHRARRARRAPPASTRSCSRSSPGRCSASATSTTGSRGARST